MSRLMGILESRGIPDGAPILEEGREADAPGGEGVCGTRSSSKACGEVGGDVAGDWPANSLRVSRLPVSRERGWSTSSSDPTGVGGPQDMAAAASPLEWASRGGICCCLTAAPGGRPPPLTGILLRVAGFTTGLRLAPKAPGPPETAGAGVCSCNPSGGSSRRAGVALWLGVSRRASRLARSSPPSTRASSRGGETAGGGESGGRGEGGETGEATGGGLVEGTAAGGMVMEGGAGLGTAETRCEVVRTGAVV